MNIDNNYDKDKQVEYMKFTKKLLRISLEVPVISLVITLIGKSILPKVMLCGLFIVTTSVFIVPWIFVIYCVYASGRSKMQEIKYLNDGSIKYHISQSSSDRTSHDIDYRIKEVYDYNVTKEGQKIETTDYSLSFEKSVSLSEAEKVLRRKYPKKTTIYYKKKNP